MTVHLKYRHESFKEYCLNLQEGDTQLLLKKLSPTRLVRNAFRSAVEAAEASGAGVEELKALLSKGRAKQGIFLGDLDEGELEIGQASALLSGKRIQAVSEVMTEALIDAVYQAGAYPLVNLWSERIKRAMKNLMDFCIGTPAFWILGFGLMFGLPKDGRVLSFIGVPDLFVRGDYGVSGSYPSYAYLIFQTVFCATSATIVSGAMAERTKFSAYCLYSFLISLLIYPISGHWIWGGGWLSQLGFHAPRR